MDIISIFAEVKVGKEHVWKGLRVLFNYLQAIGYSITYLNALRNALPKVTCGIDLKIPSESQIIKSLNMLPSAPIKYQVLYNLLLDSGLRMVEGIQLLNRFNMRDTEQLNGFYRSVIGEFRGNKQAYYAYYTEQTFKRISSANSEQLTRNASGYYYKHGYIAPKHLRKFAFDKMIELEVPESIADFIEGRVTKRIGAKHYMALTRQADNFYKRYADYIGNLRGSI
jgi:intergrase/recombinase